MKKNGRSRHMKRNLALLVLLALLCVGGAELAACRHFEPEIYETIVSPVRYAATVVVDTGRAGLNAAAQFCRDTGAAAVRFFRAVGEGVSRFALQTGERAAALWAELTTPKEPPPGETDEPDVGATAEPNAPATPPPITQLLHRDNREVLTGGVVDIPYFCQSAEAWKDQPYGTDTIGPYGCGPTVMAMAVASMTETDTDPEAMAAWAVEHGYWARRSGSYHSIVMGTARAFGMEAEAFPSRDVDDLRAALWDGKMLVALVGPGHFTNGGHFIVLHGATLDGSVLVADPANRDRSLTTWDPQLILDELSASRSSGGPLWAVSASPLQ